MTKLLIRLFVRDYRNVDQPKIRARYGTFTGIVGIIVNLLLFGGKILVAILFSSISIMADAFNNLSDAGSSIISLISFRISMKPADKGHPFGHARIEYIASLIVSFFIMLIGLELFKESVGSIRTPAVSSFDLVVTLVLAGAILAKLWLFVFYRKVGKMIDSEVLRANAMDSLSDVISTSAVLISSLVIHFTKWNRLDGIIGLLVACLILVGGIKILRESVNSILGEAPTAELVEDIRKIVAEYPEALGIHDLVVHNYGPGHTIASLHVEVDGKKDLFALHDVIDNIERQMHDQLKITCTVHMDPILIGDPLTARLRDEVTQLAAKIDPGISLHDFRTVSGPTHTNLVFDLAVPFDVKIPVEDIREQLETSVKIHLGENYYCVITVDRV